MLLEKSPERGMEEVITQYTGLVWSVVALRLQETEDVKDCVNETFSEFFLHWERFDPDKGTLKAYLAVIAQRLASKRWRENRREDLFREVGKKAQSSAEALEDNMDLEEALSHLEPVDEKIIRMKYYDGMTAKEIAHQLRLPYETVKKRHQRSLKKLYQVLTVGLIVALLAAVLAACAYVVLRYFGVVPGYAVDRDQETPIYILDQTGVSDGVPGIEEAYWNDGTLVIELRIPRSEDPIERGWEECQVTGFENLKSRWDIFLEDNGQYRRVRAIFACDIPENAGETLPFGVEIYGTELTASLRQVEELVLEEAGYYSWVEGRGGLFFVPRLENGELILSIYPLDECTYTTSIALTQGVFCGYGCPTAPVTVTAADGTVLTGHPVNYRPYSRDTYLDWNFGPAEPGEYTFHVPHLYQTTLNTQDSEWSLDLSAAPCELDDVLEFTGGELRLTHLQQEPDPAPRTAYDTMILLDQIYYEGFTWFSMEAEWISHDPERTVVGLDLIANHEQPFWLEAAGGTGDGEMIYTRTDTQYDPETGTEYYSFRDYLVGSKDAEFTLTGYLGKQVCYRWDHPFSIAFTVNN